jgi:Fe-S-cluster containining protein
LAQRRAADILQLQKAVFADGTAPEDRPGSRDEANFSRRVSALNRLHPSCPMLFDDLCSIYGARPLLCRAYGFPVDAFSVESGHTKVFRSLCHLYEGMRLSDYVRARDLRARLGEISLRLAGGREWGRFTSIEAALSTLVLDEPPVPRLS